MARYFLLTFILAFLQASSAHAQAQPCLEPQSNYLAHANQIQAYIQNGGDLFTTGSNGGFFPEPNVDDPTSAPSTMFTAGLWIGGVDQGGNLRLSTRTYRTGNEIGPYFSGPLDENGLASPENCANWDRIFVVTRARIEAFLIDRPNLSFDDAIAQYPDIMGWPAQGNPYFELIYSFPLPPTPSGMAPYYDANGTGLYEPLAGDFPAVELRGKPLFVPDEFTWCIFNTEGAGAPSITPHVQMEIRQTTWQFNCPDLAPLHNTVFTAHKMHYTGTERLDSVSAGWFIDFDLGNYTNDYVGTDPDLDAVYAYNQTALDPNLNSGGFIHPGFGDNPPVQSMTMLSKTLDHSIYTASGNGNLLPLPCSEFDTPTATNHVLNGRFCDGSTPTFGGNGYGGTTPVNHVFSDPPSDINGWSMCTANLPAGDLRMVATHQIGFFDPGGVEELVCAWTAHPNPDLPCGLGGARDDISAIRDWYDSDFWGGCAPLLVGAEEQVSPAGKITLTPNPATDLVTIAFGGIPINEVGLFSAEGRLLRSIRPADGAEQAVFDVADWAPGVYFVRLRAASGMVSAKAVVVE